MIRTVPLLSLCAASVLAGPITFHKEIIFTGVKPSNDLWAGGVVQIWAGSKWVNDTHTYWKGVNGAKDLKWPYTHAEGTPRDDKVHEGFAIQTTGTEAIDGWPAERKEPVKNWAKVKSYVRGSEAEIEYVKIDPLVDKGKIPVRNAKTGIPEPENIKDFVKAEIKGMVEAGSDKEWLTSADAYAAVYVEGSGDVFKKSDVANKAYQIYGKNQAAMAGRDYRLNKGDIPADPDKVEDPIFATLTDLTTGTQITSKLLILTITALAADFSMSDAGIRLAIHPANPDSWVEYLYSTEFDWVINPERFSLRFSNRGVEIDGDRYPLAGWQMTKTPDRWEVYFPLEGLGFDEVAFRLPVSRMVDGHDYTLGLGASNGSYDLHAAPEPVTLALTGSALVGFSLMLRRRVRRRSTVLRIIPILLLLSCLGLRATTISGVQISFEDPTVPGPSPILTDGGDIDGDGDQNGQIKLPTIGRDILPDTFQYSIDPIDPAKPIVIATGTDSGVNLVLTNLKITARDDSVSGSITFRSDWTHKAGSGTMSASVHGTFAHGPGSKSDTYNVNFVGTVAGTTANVGPLTGPPPNSLDGRKPVDISLEAGTHSVSGVLSFTLSGSSSSLTFPDSAQTGAAVPEPPVVTLLGTGLAFIGVRRLKRRPLLRGLMRKHCFVPLLAITTSATAGPIAYDKSILFTSVNPESVLYTGAVVQTWWDQLQLRTHNIWEGIERPYFAGTLRTAKDDINGGFPMQAAIKTTEPLSYSKAKNGWPEPLYALFDDATARDPDTGAEAYAKIKIEPLVKQRKVRVASPNGTEEKTYSNVVEAKLSGYAKAGDKPINSADSFAAAYVESADVLAPLPGKPESFYVLGQNRPAIAWSRESKNRGKPMGGSDPFFFTLRDLETGETWTELLLTLEYQASAAGLSISDSGIHLVVDPADPTSWIDFAFSTVFPWVDNPEEYGFHFDGSGLSTYGTRYPASAWTIEQNSGLLEARFSFGAEGMPWNLVQFTIPQGLLSEGHAYTYGFGAEEGVWQVHVAPEPSTAVLGLGLLCCALLRRRSHTAAVRQTNIGIVALLLAGQSTAAEITSFMDTRTRTSLQTPKQVVVLRERKGVATVRAEAATKATGGEGGAANNELSFDKKDGKVHEVRKADGTVLFPDADVDSLGTGAHRGGAGAREYANAGGSQILDKRTRHVKKGPLLEEIQEWTTELRTDATAQADARAAESWARAKGISKDPWVFENFALDENLILDHSILAGTMFGSTSPLATASIRSWFDTDLPGLENLFTLEIRISSSADPIINFWSNPSLGLNDAQVEQTIQAAFVFDSVLGGFKLDQDFLLLDIQLPTAGRNTLTLDFGTESDALAAVPELTTFVYCAVGLVIVHMRLRRWRSSNRFSLKNDPMARVDHLADEHSRRFVVFDYTQFGQRCWAACQGQSGLSRSARAPTARFGKNQSNSRTFASVSHPRTKEFDRLVGAGA
jgi:hypothetical protein